MLKMLPDFLRYGPGLAKIRDTNPLFSESANADTTVNLEPDLKPCNKVQMHWFIIVNPLLQGLVDAKSNLAGKELVNSTRELIDTGKIKHKHYLQTNARNTHTH